MTRIRQTAANLARELAAAKVIEAAWRCRIVKQPEHFARVDWHIFSMSGRLRAVAEHKGRDCVWARWPTSYIDIHKVSALDAKTEATGVPGVIIRHFLDAVLWLPVGAVDRTWIERDKGRWRDGVHEVCDVYVLDNAWFRRLDEAWTPSAGPTRRP